MSAKKTNAARLLDKLNISYELISYPVDENDLSAIHVAQLTGLPVEQLFKTILLRGDKTGFLVCIVPGNKEVNLKQAATLSGNKKIEPVSVKELLPLTGYIRGGCSPIGMKKTFPTFLHDSALKFPFIYISAGERGLQLKLSPQDLQRVIPITINALT
ncbi:Cys-tRNA(Pro) deacylase [Microbacter margulisiae]|uniref:Cys-tRNA(Pro)/Cys-tRNA(Cys) deacylase n=1 Tax=Microbacter margulisiae TaxID=1350067 RepID=A0A7W5DQF3_9PORP|nr:Cys-tRNA(Pro) deacylase [Microbacter margulisiae]MBB3186848.1 Cys-tRNA(Pro)/Cys-tRNA(Cys) deacylase [Microbacter margulisiae]